MLRAMDSAVSGLRAHQNKLDVIGHNIANVNTFGFKAQSYSFKEAMYQTATQSTGGVQDGNTTAAGTNGAQYGYGSMMGSISTDMLSTTPTYVGGLNACINGQGFFATQAISTKEIDVDGDAADVTDALKKAEFAYTRVGQFQLDSQGYLTDGTNFIYGFRPDGNNGFETGSLVALRVPSDLNNGFDDDALQAASVKINELGEVTATVTNPDNGESVQVSLGKIAIVTFQNQEGLMKSGGTYYSASIGDNTGLCSATIPGGSTSKLMTGYLEASDRKSVV